MFKLYARLAVMLAVMLASVTGCAFFDTGAATPTPLSGPATPVINLPPGALNTSTPTVTPTATATDRPTPTLSPTPPCVSKAQFVSDITIPDGTPLSPGSRIVKVWRVKNSGNCAWDGSYRLAEVPGGGLKADTPDAPLPPVAPGASVDIGLTVSLSIDAPIGQERAAVFELLDPSGAHFARLTVKVMVTAGTPSAPIEPTLGVGVATISGEMWSDYCHPGGTTGGGSPQGDCISNGGGGLQADGVKQSGEEGIGGVVVNLSAGACPGGTVVASKITDSKGHYLFTDLGAGSYCVWVDSLDLTNGSILIPGAWSPIPGLQIDSSGKAKATVIIASGEQGTVVNFGWDFQLD